MRIRRIPETEEKGYCHDCHNRAVIEVTFGGKRPPLRICGRDARYMGTTLLSRMDEVEAGKPIPPQRPRFKDDDSRGNR